MTCLEAGVGDQEMDENEREQLLVRQHFIILFPFFKELIINVSFVPFKVNYSFHNGNFNSDGKPRSRRSSMKQINSSYLFR